MKKGIYIFFDGQVKLSDDDLLLMLLGLDIIFGK